MNIDIVIYLPKFPYLLHLVFYLWRMWFTVHVLIQYWYNVVKRTIKCVLVGLNKNTQCG